jgi:hypothetical protein
MIKSVMKIMMNHDEISMMKIDDEIDDEINVEINDENQ